MNLTLSDTRGSTTVIYSLSMQLASTIDSRFHKQHYWNKTNFPFQAGNAGSRFSWRRKLGNCLLMSLISFANESISGSAVVKPRRGSLSKCSAFLTRRETWIEWLGSASGLSSRFVSESDNKPRHFCFTPDLVALLRLNELSRSTVN